MNTPNGSRFGRSSSSTGGSRTNSTGSGYASRAPRSRSGEAGKSFNNSGPRPSYGSAAHANAGNYSSSSFSRSSSSAGGPRRSFGGSARPSYSGGRSSFASSGNRSKRGPKSDYIDENRFINRATTVVEEVHVAKHTFADFNVHPSLQANLDAKGFVQPSPIQDQAIPVALKGGDIIGIANTGTGKTIAFLIPIINKLVKDRNHKVMILTPTRELAQQIETEFRALTSNMKLWSVCVVGGLPIMRQIRQLEMGVHIVIGTPGRVKDLIARNKIVMSQFGTIVLDEADRMLDMGFIDDMRLILGAMPKERQTMFFSATFSPEIKLLCNTFLTDPITVAIKTRDTAANVDQDVVRVGHVSDKITKLHDLLINPDFKKVLIFRETKHHTDELAKELRARGFAVSALHGDMRSRERSRAVEALSKGQIQAVVATDVAARGIDIPDITHVINYDTPSTYDTYVHRIGRTGRGDKKGTALTFVR
ncbi:MAG: box helicase, ATP-dependent helicase RhlE [Candidatus Nomurabacteria bacterium]|nr:box helicase, ATP-dependent helicase RhlE [Candidatus Nomurabacteria bacterium]